MLTDVINCLIGVLTSYTPNGLEKLGWKNSCLDGNIEDYFNIENSGEPSMRKCCTIGLDDPSATGVGATEVMNFAEVSSEHKYGQDLNFYEKSDDKVGHIYTKHGGIIDIAHARDHADLTRYIAHHAKKHLLTGGGTLNLSNEAGERVITFLPGKQQVTRYEIALIAAKASYDVSVWHEINTYKNSNTFFPQDYSAFSPEDNFSNLLGCLIGFNAILDPKHDFNLAVQIQFHRILHFILKESPSKEITTRAINYVKDYWYEYNTGTLNLLRRHLGYSPIVTPWLITDVTIAGKQNTFNQLKTELGSPKALSINVPEGLDFSKYYRFEILNLDLPINHPFTASDPSDGPVEPLPPDDDVILNSKDFHLVVNDIKAEVLSQDPNAAQPN